MEKPELLELLKNLTSSVIGAIVRCDNEVDPTPSVELNVFAHDIRFVADQKSHDELCHIRLTRPGENSETTILTIAPEGAPQTLPVQTAPDAEIIKPMEREMAKDRR